MKTVATNLWVRVAADISRAIKRVVGYWEVRGITDAGRLRVASFDPAQDGEVVIRKLRGIAVSPGDAVVSVRLPGLFEVALGAVARDGESDAEALAPGGTTMRVAAVSGNLVSLNNLDGEAMGAAVRAGGFDVAPGDLVLAMRLGRSEGGAEYAVVDRIDPSPVTARSLRTALTVVGKFFANAGIINSDPRWTPLRADAATTASTVNTSTYVDAYSADFTLPPGTFNVQAAVSLAMKRSPAGQAHMRVLIDGAAGAVRTVNGDAAVWTTHNHSGAQGNIAGGRAITITIQYKGNTGTGVTTSAAEPLIDADYERIA